jgi:hypothetical protein
MLQMEYDPDGLVESAGDLVGVTSRRVVGDLERFKEFIESRGTATGAWRRHNSARRLKVVRRRQLIDSRYGSSSSVRSTKDCGKHK